MKKKIRSVKENHFSHEKRMELYNSCVPMAHFIMRRFRFLNDTDFDDVTQAALIGLWDAAVTFNHMREAEFTTYAHWKIRGGISSALRDLNKFTTKTMTTDFSDDSQGSFDYAMSGLATTENAPEDIASKAELFQRIMSFVNELPEKKRACIIGYYLERKTYNQIGIEIGFTKERVRQIVNLFIKSVRERMGIVYEPAAGTDSQNPFHARYYHQGSEALPVRRKLRKCGIRCAKAVKVSQHEG